ncbi:hypothetical protein FOMPIDRAFT_1059592 [Fomitopsis schrenkii]|uniref:Uncharacterized protein n=1 Tax=Fomitopsis schrenkii TaxID=2126942 RepID=S8EBA0_FOMSC|nr:hypothetical protein FOMPIDRAFT_1059592 [Fomitopsis schrenkii]
MESAGEAQCPVFGAPYRPRLSTSKPRAAPRRALSRSPLVPMRPLQEARFVQRRPAAHGG